MCSQRVLSSYGHFCPIFHLYALAVQLSTPPSVIVTVPLRKHRMYSMDTKNIFGKNHSITSFVLRKAAEQISHLTQHLGAGLDDL